MIDVSAFARLQAGAQLLIGELSIGGGRRVLVMRAGITPGFSVGLGRVDGRVRGVRFGWFFLSAHVETEADFL